MSKKKKIEFNRLEYLLKHGTICPYCRSENINSGETEFNDHLMFQTAHCDDCSKSWVDTYTLTDVSEVNYSEVKEK